MKTIRMRLILVYSAITIATLVVIGFFINGSINQLFEQYAKDRQKSQIEYIRNQIPELYQEESESFDIQGIEVAANAALQNGLIVHIQTMNQEIDWDINTHKNQECQLMLQHSENNMHSRYPNFVGGYTEEKYDFLYGDHKTGHVIIGYYGPYSLDDNELILINEINKILFLLGVIFLVLVVLLTVLISRSITYPITSAITVAGKIANGKYGTQIDQKSRNEETQNLIDAINDMSVKLQTEEKQKRQITADVAHELRTPLSNLQGNLEAMLDGIWEPNQEKLLSCHEEIIRLASIVQQMQVLYSLENRNEQLECESIDFSVLCRSLSVDFAMKLEAKQIRLTVYAKKGDIVWGDRYKIRQCMINLISNAIQYSDVGGEIELHISNDDQYTTILVKDHGVGIPADELPNLFERFYRVDKSRSTKTGGMGIGLSITKAIVERHGGMISVESTPGKGSTFIMTFPQKSEK